jgi:NhaP-type Na+/H+ or K+/H+ antiporter
MVAVTAAARAAAAAGYQQTVRSFVVDAAKGAGLGLAIGVVWYHTCTRSFDDQIAAKFFELKHGEAK